MAEKSKKMISLAMDEDIIKELQDEADATGTSRSEVIRRKLVGADDKENDNKPLIFVFSSHKGGVAKTTSACNVAVELAEKGYKTLLIDLDGQGSASEYLHVYDEDAERKCIADIMIPSQEGKKTKLSEVVRQAIWIDDDEETKHEIENLHVVPSDLRFDNADSKMKNSNMASVDTRLRDAIEDMDEEEGTPYQIIIIDCPPRVDLVLTNAITALDAGASGSMIIVPVRPDGFSKRGMSSTVSAITAVSRAKRMKPIKWVLLRTIDEPRTNLSKILEQNIRDDYPNAKILDTKIEKYVVVMESNQFYRPLAYYADNSKSRSQYIKLAEELLKEAGYGD